MIWYIYATVSRMMHAMRIRDDITRRFLPFYIFMARYAHIIMKETIDRAIYKGHTFRHAIAHTGHDFTISPTSFYDIVLQNFIVVEPPYRNAHSYAKMLLAGDDLYIHLILCYGWQLSQLDAIVFFSAWACGAGWDHFLIFCFFSADSSAQPYDGRMMHWPRFT